MKIHAFRLLPGQDLKIAIQNHLREKNISAGIILGSVGSLSEARLRFAGQEPGSVIQGPLEIITLSGTLSVNGSHLHICISDKEGKTFGGHLVDGCIIRTTAEIVLGETTGFEFTREHDASSGYKELVVKTKN